MKLMLADAEHKGELPLAIEYTAPSGAVAPPLMNQDDDELLPMLTTDVPMPVASPGVGVVPASGAPDEGGMLPLLANEEPLPSLPPLCNPDEPDEVVIPPPPAAVEIEGIRIHVRREYFSGGGRQSERWSVTKCPIHGSACTKSRSVVEDMGGFGANGVRIFLGAWLLKAMDSDITYENHADENPTVEQMEAYGRSRGLL